MTFYCAAKSLKKFCNLRDRMQKRGSKLPLDTTKHPNVMSFKPYFMNSKLAGKQAICFSPISSQLL